MVYAGFMRTTIWDLATSPELAGQRARIAMVGARNATHMTSALPQTFASPAAEVTGFPVTQPVEQIVAGLNAYQPSALMGYPSMLALLAAEARTGRLRILPRRITTTSEPLLPEVRQTPAGAEVLVVGDPADPAAAGRRLEAELARVGLPAPAVEVRVVDRLERQATGKIRRFRPLEAVAVSRPG